MGGGAGTLASTATMGAAASAICSADWAARFDQANRLKVGGNEWSVDWVMAPYLGPLGASSSRGAALVHAKVAVFVVAALNTAESDSPIHRAISLTLTRFSKLAAFLSPRCALVPALRARSGRLFRMACRW